MSNKNNIWRKLAGKGYYIALIVCAVAIGISGYLYYRNLNQNAQLSDAVSDQAQTDANIPAIATKPSEDVAVDATVSAKPIKTGMPVEGETVMTYSMDSLSYDPTTRDWRVHNGIDIAAQTGAEVKAAADGVVYTTYQDEAMGTTVVIRHDGGYVTTYSSLDSELTVATGDTVTLGQTIGYVGCSAMMETALGSHVHFCVTLEDVTIDPADFFSLG